VGGGWGEEAGIDAPEGGGTPSPPFRFSMRRERTKSLKIN
jgi:hypothetical protein